VQTLTNVLAAGTLSKPETLAKFSAAPVKTDMKPLTKGWFVLDGDAEQQVQVEQAQSVPKPLLGPLEMTMLAGLVGIVLARHLADVFHSAGAKSANVTRRSERSVSSKPRRKA